ncbi:MAG: hypothetical protein WBP45_02855 [Daejeonella sp.]
MKQEEKEQLKGFFEKYPQVDAFYTTSDGQVFSVKHFADGHASGLSDKKVDTHHRVVVEATEKVTKTKTKAPTDPVTENIEPIKTNTDQEPAAVASEANTDQTPVAETTALNTDQASVEDKAALVSRYKELFGKAPNNLIGIEKLKSAIAAKEAESK